jgi:hypothetical protein
LTDDDLHQLSEAVDLYSVIHSPLSDRLDDQHRTTFLAHVKAPFLRLCLQRILKYFEQQIDFDAQTISDQFFQQHIIDMIQELIGGSERLNQTAFLHQLKLQLKKNKDLPERVYRQMVKDKLIALEPAVRKEKKGGKVRKILQRTKEILNNDGDRVGQHQLVHMMSNAAM